MENEIFKIKFTIVSPYLEISLTKETLSYASIMKNTNIVERNLRKLNSYNIHG